MTPKMIRLRIERFWEREKQKQKQLEYYAWLTGYFNQFAIGSSMSKKIKYPDNPLEEKRVVTEDIELTEEEKKLWRKKILGDLRDMNQKRKEATEGE